MNLAIAFAKSHEKCDPHPHCRRSCLLTKIFLKVMLDRNSDFSRCNWTPYPQCCKLPLRMILLFSISKWNCPQVDNDVSMDTSPCFCIQAGRSCARLCPELQASSKGLWRPPFLPSESNRMSGMVKEFMCSCFQSKLPYLFHCMHTFMVRLFSIQDTS